MPSQEKVIDSLVGGFESDLRVIVPRAAKATTARLIDRLSVTDGTIAKTRTNVRVLQSVDDVFQREMNRAGYRELVRRFVTSFNGQLPFFQDTLDALAKQIGRPLDIQFSSRDKGLFVQQQMTAARLLDAVVDQAAASVERTAMLSVGGIKLSDLIGAISEKLDATVGQATTLGDTALSMFYRTIADRGFKKVQQALPAGDELLFGYGGPDDRLTRPFCHKRLAETAAGKVWTRAEIDAMDNGQIPGVFLTCGGWNCRHQWLVKRIR